MNVTATRSRDDFDYTPIQDDASEPLASQTTEADASSTHVDDSAGGSDSPAPVDASSSGTRIGSRWHAESTDGTVFAEASLLHGRDSRNGLEVSAFDVSGEASSDKIDLQFQGTMGHLGISSDDGRTALRGDVFAATAHLGTKNADGSEGFNIGGGATVLSIEGTVPIGDSVTATVGVAMSAGASVSLGVRDADHDGKIEYCGHVEVLFGIAGLCVENPF
jgi:hypothetical protein